MLNLIDSIMKGNHFITRRELGGVAMAAIATMFFGSCAVDGFDENEKYSSGVSDTQLASPSADGITITASADGSTQTISWPVVFGAGGYQVSFYDASNEAKPIIADSVVHRNQIIVEREEDMNYKIAVKALGNAELNNTDAAEASSKEFSTFTPTFAEIPEGDLYEYFTNNPVPDEALTSNLKYNLVPGGNYTMSQPIDFEGHNVTLRCSDVNNRPNVKLAVDSKFKTYAGLTLRNLVIDCSETSDFIVLDKEPNEGIKVESGEYVINQPISVVGSYVKGITGRFIYDSGIKYALANFVVSNSIIEVEEHSDLLLSFKKSIPINMVFKKSTFWSKTQNSGYWAQIHGNEPKKVTGFTEGTFSFDHSTFVNLAYSKQFINTNTLKGRASLKLYFDSSIFVDCGKGEIMNRITNGTSQFSKASNNTYWYNGAIANEKYDTNVLTTDPGFADPANGNFTISGAEQLAKKTGDPRWIP